MEKNLKLKISSHFNNNKTIIRQWIEDGGFKLIDNSNNDRTRDFINQLNNMQPYELTKEDFKRRTRVRTVIPKHSQCRAVRLNGEQCTRKKKANCEYCGTHLKGLPKGEVEEEQLTTTEESPKIEIWIEEICGIHQYIDKNGNIYSTEDIMQNTKNPRIISKWKKNDKDEYVIN
jgi:hypothetical protein